MGQKLVGKTGDGVEMEGVAELLTSSHTVGTSGVLIMYGCTGSSFSHGC